jgi:predicted transcriptional regulator
MRRSICFHDIIAKQMPSILIQLDEPLLRSLNKVAPAAKRQRAEFIRQAVKDAIRKREYEAIREAYLRQPDSAEDADDWSNADEWKP